MKRIFAFLFVTIMIIGIFPVILASAADTPTVSASDAVGYPGGQITVYVNIDSNPGIIAMGLQIGYDQSLFELLSAAAKDFAEPSFGPISGNPFNITWEDVLNPDNTQNGTVAELTFLIKEGTALGEYTVTISYDEDNIFNSEFENVYFAKQNGKITVAEKPVAVTGVTIDKTVSLNISENKVLVYTVDPDNATNKSVSFTSSDPSVVSVDETTGEITGKKKGTATVTITTDDGGFTDICTVTVICPHTGKTQFVENAPTCTEQGWDAYSVCDTCGQLLDAFDNEIDEIPYRALLGHTYAEPEWIWDNEYIAKAEFSCIACNSSVTLDATVVKTEDKGIITYTATAEFNDNTYTDKKTEYVEYTIKFVDYNGRVLSEETYFYGDAVTEPKDPVREEDDKYTYTFKGWDKDITAATSDATYTALYDMTVKYTFLFGDINGDGEVNNKDVVTLFRYLSGVEVDVNETALDVNGDGKVNNKDVTILFRYLNKNEAEISDKPYISSGKATVIAIIPNRVKIH